MKEIQFAFLDWVLVVKGLGCGYILEPNDFFGMAVLRDVAMIAFKIFAWVAEVGGWPSWSGRFHAGGRCRCSRLGQLH